MRGLGGAVAPGRPHAPSSPTPRQVARILDLIDDGAHHKPGTITGPTTAEGIADLARLQACVYQHSLQHPHGPTRHSVRSFTGTLKITFIDLTTGEAVWAVTLPGASELHGTSIGIDEITE